MYFCVSPAIASMTSIPLPPIPILCYRRSAELSFERITRSCSWQQLANSISLLYQITIAASYMTLTMNFTSVYDYGVIVA